MYNLWVVIYLTFDNTWLNEHYFSLGITFWEKKIFEKEIPKNLECLWLLNNMRFLLIIIYFMIIIKIKVTKE